MLIIVYLQYQQIQIIENCVKMYDKRGFFVNFIFYFMYCSFILLALVLHFLHVYRAIT